jgi:hypothetical protein
VATGALQARLLDALYAIGASLQELKNKKKKHLAHRCVNVTAQMSEMNDEEGDLDALSHLPPDHVCPLPIYLSLFLSSFSGFSHEESTLLSSLSSSFYHNS